MLGAEAYIVPCLYVNILFHVVETEPKCLPGSQSSQTGILISIAMLIIV